MFERTVTEADLARLKAEREEADRLYNEALSALDRATQRLGDFPVPPTAPDEHQLPSLSRLWPVVPAHQPAEGAGWRARLQGLIWRTIAPLLERQQEFNAALVDHLNRNVAAEREVRQAIATTIAILRDQLSSLVSFESHLIVYLQRITPYVDTKDREVTGLMRRINEDNTEMTNLLDHRTVGLAGAINGVGDELLKRWESMVARERRYEARVSRLTEQLTAFQEDVVGETRTALSSLQQLTATLKREFERAMTTGGLTGAVGAELGPGASTAARSAESSSMPNALGSSALDSYKYVGFEDLFRGSQEDIRTRVAEYLPDFEGAADVLDIGCGRGEFLDLLKEHNIPARGLDINHEMVEVCRARGLDAVEGDALSYVESLDDNSLGGVFAAQVIEHLQPDYLLRLLGTLFHKLKPGSTIVLETINPACWFAFFQSYIRDITHVRPLHPDTMKYLLVASGFRGVRIRYRAPYPEHEKLQPLPQPSNPDPNGDADAALVQVDTFNQNVEKINRLLFTYLDYAVIGSK